MLTDFVPPSWAIDALGVTIMLSCVAVIVDVVRRVRRGEW